MKKEWKLEENKLDYWDWRWYTHFNASMYVFVGGRRYGKTYSPKYLAIKNHFKKGHKYMYIRRYRNEIDAVKHDLFTDVANDMGVDVRIEGQNMYVRKQPPAGLSKNEIKNEFPWEHFGYCIALSQQQIYRSASFPDVTLIHYDEFIPENKRQRELPNEYNMLISLFETVNRNRTNCRLLLTANSISLDNFVFRALKIKLGDFKNGKDYKHHSYEDRIVTRNKGKILIGMLRSEHNEQIIKKSTMGQLANENYLEYAVYNRFTDGHDAFIIPKKPKNAEYAFTFTDGDDKLDVFVVPETIREYGYWVSSNGKGNELFSTDKTMPIPDAPYRHDILRRCREFTHNLMIRYQNPESRILWFTMIKP